MGNGIEKKERKIKRKKREIESKEVRLYCKKEKERSVSIYSTYCTVSETVKHGIYTKT